ncbi:hypothetical protein ABZS98_27825 [Streptomyces avermitilis]|uniref:hypothetical protein n=1 Tax=Streptomyces avermitilis TaxID=33903 RepID=UPI0033BC21E3
MARVPLPPGVVMGAATVLSTGDRCAVAAMYPALNPSPHNTWVGRFDSAAPGHHLLFHSTARRHWFTGTTASGALSFTDRGDSSGFGDLADGRPLWAGEFTGDGRTGLLAHNPADQSWLFGAARSSDGRMVWSQIGTTSGFGDIATDPFWTGDFTGEGRTSLLFHHPADHNWFLGTCRLISPENPQCADLRADISRRENDIRTWEEIRSKLDPREDRQEFKDATDRIAAFRKEQNDARILMSQLGCPRLPNPGGAELDWAHVGNTSGFGRVTANPFWTGDFTGEGRTSLLFHYPGDGNWWLGTVRNGQLTWAYVGNTNHLGDMTERQFWTGDFTGDGHTDLLFRNPADHNWFLGTLHHTPAEDTLCATLRADITRHRTEIRTLQTLRDGLDPRLDRDAIRDINSQITAHNQQITSARTEMATLGCPPTPNPGGSQLQWTPVGNTSGFGDINGPYWTGDFTGDGRTDLMFHYAGDLNWWRGTLIANNLTWTLAATW